MVRTATRRLAPVAAIVAVVTLGVTSCGDDDATDVTGPASTEGGELSTGSTVAPLDIDEDEYVAAVASALDVGNEGVATCVARSVVDAVGFENIQTAGVTPEEFTAASSLADVNLSMDDDQAEQMRSSVAACDGLVAAVLADAEFSDSERACVEDLLTDDLAAELLVAELGDAAPSPQLQAAAVELEGCSDE